MSEFTVEKGVEIPPEAGRIGAVSKYPWEDMQPGDSIFVSGDKTKARAARSSYGGFAKRHPEYRFVAAYREEDGEVGLRVWRVAIQPDETLTAVDTDEYDTEAA